MNVNNPYAQAGWYNPQNPHSINQWPWRSNTSHPPTFGALPDFLERPASVQTFTFTSFNPDICNCIVRGPYDRSYFGVRTNASVTVIAEANIQSAGGLIEWGRHPTVEAAGIIARERAGDFLKLSPDQTYRTMEVDKKVYAWIPRENGIYLYSAGPHPPVEFARMRLSNDMTKVYLELTSEAFPAGLFKPAIISTLLLFSGRALD